MLILQPGQIFLCTFNQALYKLEEQTHMGSWSFSLKKKTDPDFVYQAKKALAPETLHSLIYDYKVMLLFTPTVEALYGEI